MKPIMWRLSRPATHPPVNRLLAALMFFVLFFQIDFAKFQLITGLIKCSAKKPGKNLTAGQLGFLDISLIWSKNLIQPGFGSASKHLDFEIASNVQQEIELNGYGFRF